jgi:cell division protein FtsI/penicillin-binding protein 2
MTAALANGGNVLRPRLVDRIESQDPASLEPPQIFPRSEVRDLLGTTRKYVQALLEHLDAIGVTVREGDFRKLKP